MIEKRLPGTSGRRERSAKSQAQTTTKAGFMNSDGWTLSGPKSIQRRAPFTSMPKNSAITITTSAPASMMIDMRRTPRGERSEVASITAMEGNRKSACRLTKWNGSSPIFSATGGLAAKDSTMPPIIRIRKAARNQRSIDHHQSVMRPFLARLDMAQPFEESSVAGSAATSWRNVSPRTSKFRNWSKLAQAGDRRTTSSSPVRAASRAASSTATSNVPEIS